MERSTRGRRLLVWDAPNMDMCLSEVIGERASAATRPNLDAVLAWLQRHAQPGDQVEACVFINVPPGFEPAMSAWVVGLRHAGFAVFAKPKRTHRDDVDNDITSHIERRFSQGSLVELVVASHDAKAFAGPLRRLAKAGVAVTVLGYREKDAFAAASPELIFVDLEDLSDVFERPLPRTNLFDLPPGGRWFEPFANPDERPRGRHAAEDDEDAAAERERNARDAIGPAPGTDAVVSAIVVEVQAAVASGGSGLSLRDAGDLLRDRFPDHGLADMGFASFTQLIDVLLERTGLVLLRRPGLGTVIAPAPGPPATSARTDPHEPPTPVEVSAPTSAGGPPPPSEAAPRAEAAVALTLVGRTGPDIDNEGAAGDGTVNPIYRAFGLGQPASQGG